MQKKTIKNVTETSFFFFKDIEKRKNDILELGAAKAIIGGILLKTRVQKSGKFRLNIGEHKFTEKDVIKWNSTEVEIEMPDLSPELKGLLISDKETFEFHQSGNNITEITIGILSTADSERERQKRIDLIGAVGDRNPYHTLDFTRDLRPIKVTITNTTDIRQLIHLFDNVEYTSAIATGDHKFFPEGVLFDEESRLALFGVHDPVRIGAMLIVGDEPKQLWVNPMTLHYANVTGRYHGEPIGIYPDTYQDKLDVVHAKVDFNLTPDSSLRFYLPAKSKFTFYFIPYILNRLWEISCDGNRSIHCYDKPSGIIHQDETDAVHNIFKKLEIETFLKFTDDINKFLRNGPSVVTVTPAAVPEPVSTNSTGLNTASFLAGKLIQTGKLEQKTASKKRTKKATRK